MSSSDIQDLQAYLSSLEETLQQREKELQLTASYGKTLLEENEKLNREIEAIENDSPKGKNIQLDHSIEELNGYIENAMNKLQSIERIHESLQNNISSKDNEITQLNQKIFEAEKLIKEYNFQISVAKETINDLRKYHDSTLDLKNEYERVRENLNQLKLTFEEQERTIKELEDKVSNNNVHDHIVPSKQESHDNRVKELMLENENLNTILKNKKEKLLSLEQFIKENEYNNDEEEELILKIQQLKEENDILNRQIEMKENAIRQSKLSRQQNAQSPDFVTYKKSKSSLRDQLMSSMKEQPTSPNSSSTSITHIYNTTTDDESKLLLKNQQDSIEVLKKSLVGTETLLTAKQEEILNQISSLKDSMKSMPKKKKTSSVKKEGYLIKQGKFVKSWMRRFFYLTNNILYYSKSKEKRVHILGHIDLNGAIIRTNKIPSLPNLISIITPLRTYYLRAETENEMLEWVEALEASQESEMVSDEENTNTSM